MNVEPAAMETEPDTGVVPPTLQNKSLLNEIRQLSVYIPFGKTLRGEVLDWRVGRRLAEVFALTFTLVNAINIEGPLPGVGRNEAKEGGAKKQRGRSRKLHGKGEKDSERAR